MADVNVPEFNYGQLLQNYVGPQAQMAEAEAGLAGARAQVAGAQAQGIGIGNQQAALNLALFKNGLAQMGGLNDFSGQMNGPVPDESSGGSSAPPDGASSGASSTGSGAPNGSAAAPPSSDASGAQAPQGDGSATNLANGLPLSTPHMQALLRSRFFVDPQGTPQLQNFMQVAAMSGSPQLQAWAKYERDLYVSQQTAENQKDANTLYDLMNNVADVAPTAPKGTAFATLQRIAPQAAARIEARLGPDGDLDAAARQYATAIATNVHQYTGRKVTVGKDGVARDAVTGLPLTGVPNTGPAPGEWLKLAQNAYKPVSVQQGTATVNIPLWKYSGAPNPATFMMKQASQLGLIAPGGAGSNVAMAHMRNAIAQVQNGQLQNGQRAPAQNGASSNADTSITSNHPVLQKALQDPSYRLSTPTYALGQGASAGQKEQELTNVKNKQSLQDDQKIAVQASQQALTYLTAAQRILQSKGAPDLNVGGAASYAIKRAFGGVTASNYQQVAKYLSNAALQNARALYGSRMTQTEVKLQLHQMNPNVAMTDASVNKLIDENIRNANYALQSASRVPVYLHAGNDPQYFYQWNQKYWPQQVIVNKGLNPDSNNTGNNAANAPKEGMTAVARNGRPIVFRNGQWVYK